MQWLSIPLEKQGRGWSHPNNIFVQKEKEIFNMSGSRQTYKKELISRIKSNFKRTTLKPFPETCLNDMSTSSLAEFEEWIEPLIVEFHRNKNVKLLPPKRD